MSCDTFSRSSSMTFLGRHGGPPAADKSSVALCYTRAHATRRRLTGRAFAERPRAKAPAASSQYPEMTRRSSGHRDLMSRRALIWRSIGIFALGRTVHAAPAPQPRFRALRRPIRIPLAQLTEPWRPVWFDAIAPARRAGSGPAEARHDAAASVAVRVSGVALRLPSASGPAGVKAFCLTCPHEICRVGYATDPASVRLDGAPRPDHPLLVCPCHFSAFDPAAEGTRIAGPATRGLYRFRLDVHQDSVAITHVEEGALG